MGAILRKYATGTGGDIYIPIIKRGVLDFAVSGDWTPAAGDVKVSKDGGTDTNIGTLPVFTNGNWKFVFTDAELTAAFIVVKVVDSATKAVEDQAILIETYGNASAQHAMDLDDASLQGALTEIAQGVPSATPTLEDAIMLMYMALRNKLDVTSTFKEVHNDAGTVITKKALTDDGATYSEAKTETG